MTNNPAYKIKTISADENIGLVVIGIQNGDNLIVVEARSKNLKDAALNAVMKVVGGVKIIDHFSEKLEGGIQAQVKIILHGKKLSGVGFSTISTVIASAYAMVDALNATKK